MPYELLLPVHSYKIQLVHNLKYGDKVNYKTFCHLFLDLINANNECIHNILISDEAVFHLCGYVIKHNFRYWSQTNPYEMHKVPLHNVKVTVRCGIISIFVRVRFYLMEIFKECGVQKPSLKTPKD